MAERARVLVSRRAGVLIAVIGLLAGMFSAFTSVVQAAPVLPGVIGNFEVDGDQTNTGGTTIDWGDVTPTILIDAISPDNGLQGSSKEDEPEDFVCQDKSPTVTPGKDNLVRAYINTRVSGPGSIFLDLGFVREDGGTQGDSHVNFEFNQNLVTNLCPYTGRVDGDLLITFDFPGNAAVPADVQTFTWDADAPDGPDNPGKWVPFTFTGAVAAEDNVAPVTDEVVGGNVVARAFGEATIDLVALADQTDTGGDGCLNFGFASIRSRSSGQSFSSALQDIMGSPVDISTCGKVVVHKVDDAGKALNGATFGLWPAAATVPAVGVDGARPSTGSLATCTSAADGTCTFDDLDPGDYKIAELSAPAGYSIDPDVVGVSVVSRETVDVAAPFVDPLNTGTVRVTKAVTSGGQPFAVHPADLAGLTFILEQAGVPVSTWPPPGSPAECSLSGASLSCDIGPVPLGDYTVTEDPATLPDGVSQGPDVAVTVDADAATVPVTITNPLNPIDIHLDKAGPDVANIGEVITYTFDVTTTGEPLTITGLAEVVDLPGNFADRCDTAVLTGPDKSTAVDPDNDADAFIEAGETWRWTCQHAVTMADATDADGVLLQNKASVTGEDRFGRVVSDDDTHLVTIRLPGLTITKVADDPAVVSAGDDIGFTIEVKNSSLPGVGRANDVTLTDPLPAGDGVVWAIDSQSGGAGCAVTGTAPTQTLACGPLDLAAGTGFSVHVASPTQPSGAECVSGTLSNEATASASNHADITAEDTIVVQCPDVSVTKVADDEDPVDAGNDIGFTITVTNAGPGAAHGVSVSDPLPGTDVVVWTIASSDGGCLLLLGTLTCEVGDLPATGSFSVHVTATTPSGLDNPDLPAACKVYDNTVGVVVGNDTDLTASDSTEVICPLDITIVKDGPALAHRGDEVTYTFTVTNSGQADLVTVQLTDPICDDGTLVLADDSDGDDILAVGEVWSYECTRVVTTTDPDPLPNTASVIGTDVRGRTAEDIADHLIDLIDPRIEVVKTVDNATPSVGQTITFTYVVTNTGDTTLFGVEVVDDQLGTVGTVDELAAGESATLAKTMVVATSSPNRNIATATGADVLGMVVTDDDDAQITIVAGSVSLPRTGTDPYRLLLAAFLLLANGLLFVLMGSASSAGWRHRYGEPLT